MVWSECQAIHRFPGDGERVQVEDVDIDRYGRVVGFVFVGDLILNRHLLEYVFAWVYHRYCEKPFCSDWAEVEAQARKNKLGLWKSPNVIPPWEYRHSGKRKPSQSGKDKDYSDFAPQAEAQRFFEAHQPGDPHRLDGDGEGWLKRGCRDWGQLEKGIVFDDKTLARILHCLENRFF